MRDNPGTAMSLKAPCRGTVVGVGIIVVEDEDEDEVEGRGRGWDVGWEVSNTMTSLSMGVI